MGEWSKGARWAAAVAVGAMVWGVAPVEAPAKFGLGFGGGSRIGRGMGSRHSGQVGSGRSVSTPRKMSWETSAAPKSPVARERFEKRPMITVRQRILIHKGFSQQDASTAHQVVEFGAPEEQGKVDVRAFDPKDVFKVAEREAGALMLWTAPTESLGMGQMYGAPDEAGGEKMGEAFEAAKGGGAYASLTGFDSRGELARAIAEPGHRAVVMLGHTSGEGRAERLHLTDGTWVRTSWVHRTCAQYHTRCVIAGWRGGGAEGKVAFDAEVGKRALEAAKKVAKARGRFDERTKVREAIGEVVREFEGQEGVVVSVGG